jgi:signal peptidase I
MSLPRTARFVLREIVMPLGLAIVLALTIQATIAKPYEIPTASMDPNILPNDRVLSNRVIYRVRDIRRGDIIVFDPPASLHSDVPFVKRVVGLSGDTVEVRGGTVLVNGAPYDVAGAAVPHYTYGPARVPAGSLFVLGDNRNNSMDSHEWDFLARDSVRGEVFMIYWPLNRLRIF